VASSKDRVLPAVAETGRLLNLLPHSKRVILPTSGHTVLLEADVDIAAILATHGFAPTNHTPEKGVKGVTLVSPLVVGEGNLQLVQRELAQHPSRSVLFVGNHTIYGFYDTPLLLYELYMRGFKCRCLAHPSFWLQESLGELLESFGHVKPSPRALYELLQEGGPALVFPGGSKETCRLKGEKYQLWWGPDESSRGRTGTRSSGTRSTSDTSSSGDGGMMRMAAKLNTIIVPFAMVGADDA
ncbi:unnamed protein product, partial [Closterium sp. Naga37s-1]